MSQSRSSQATPNSLQTDRGNTTIEAAVVSKVAGMAVQEIDGVHMGGGAQRAVGGLLTNLPGGGSSQVTRGVSVQVGESEAAIDLAMAVDYGRPIPPIAEAVRNNVISRVEGLVGLTVRYVNITVNDVILPQQAAQTQEQLQAQSLA